MTLVRKDKTGGFLEVRHYKDLLIQLVSRDLKLKYRRSFLGYVWASLVRSLCRILRFCQKKTADGHKYVQGVFIYARRNKGKQT